MKSRHKRAGIVIGSSVLAALLTGVAAAWACVGIASVELTPGHAVAGDTVSAKLTNFNTYDPTFSPIELHWGGINGPLVASAKGTQVAASNSKLSFTVPQSVPGNYLVVATQYDSSGNPAFGTPARATLTVPGRAAGVAPKAGAGPAAPVVNIRQTYVIDKAPAAALAGRAPAAVTALTAVRPLEDAITEQVAPASARNVRYVPASERRSPNTMPLKAGIGLAAVGVMSLLTAASALTLVRRSQLGVNGGSR